MSTTASSSPSVGVISNESSSSVAPQSAIQPAQPTVSGGPSSIQTACPTFLPSHPSYPTAPTQLAESSAKSQISSTVPPMRFMPPPPPVGGPNQITKPLGSSTPLPAPTAGIRRPLPQMPSVGSSSLSSIGRPGVSPFLTTHAASNAPVLLSNINGTAKPPVPTTMAATTTATSTGFHPFPNPTLSSSGVQFNKHQFNPTLSQPRVSQFSQPDGHNLPIPAQPTFFLPNSTSLPQKQQLQQQQQSSSSSSSHNPVMIILQPGEDPSHYYNQLGISPDSNSVQFVAPPSHPTSTTPLPSTTGIGFPSSFPSKLLPPSLAAGRTMPTLMNHHGAHPGAPSALPSQFSSNFPTPPTPNHFFAPPSDLTLEQQQQLQQQQQQQQQPQPPPPPQQQNDTKGSRAAANQRYAKRNRPFPSVIDVANASVEIVVPPVMPARATHAVEPSRRRNVAAASSTSQQRPPPDSSGGDKTIKRRHSTRTSVDPRIYNELNDSPPDVVSFEALAAVSELVDPSEPAPAPSSPPLSAESPLPNDPAVLHNSASAEAISAAIEQDEQRADVAHSSEFGPATGLDGDLASVQHAITEATSALPATPSNDALDTPPTPSGTGQRYNLRGGHRISRDQLLIPKPHPYYSQFYRIPYNFDQLNRGIDPEYIETLKTVFPRPPNQYDKVTSLSRRRTNTPEGFAQDYGTFFQIQPYRPASVSPLYRSSARRTNTVLELWCGGLYHRGTEQILINDFHKSKGDPNKIHSALFPSLAAFFEFVVYNFGRNANFMQLVTPFNPAGYSYGFLKFLDELGSNEERRAAEMMYWTKKLARLAHAARPHDHL